MARLVRQCPVEEFSMFLIGLAFTARPHKASCYLWELYPTERLFELSTIDFRVPSNRPTF